MPLCVCVCVSCNLVVVEFMNEQRRLCDSHFCSLVLLLFIFDGKNKRNQLTHAHTPTPIPTPTTRTHPRKTKREKKNETSIRAPIVKDLKLVLVACACLLVCLFSLVS